MYDYNTVKEYWVKFFKDYTKDCENFWKNYFEAVKNFYK